MSDTLDAATNLEIAIIGMAGRFPGASDVDGLWRNLMQGKESIRRFSHEELRASGVPFRVYSDPAYVPAKGALDEDVALFDPHFFGMTPREAALVDPQHRVLLECAWEAFEDAACDPRAFAGRAGAFASASKNTYLLFNLLPQEDLASSADVYAILAGNEKDYIAPRLAYAFGLQGPSVSVQTACSSGLVALHLACQSLLAGECDMALVGAAAVDVPQFAGYHYREGAMLSRDGRCRPFDAAASGTVFGNGAAAVVLRRLEDAVAGRDPIRAVIRGTATNNDGSRKTSFGVPSLAGQTEVAVEALSAAAVDPASVGYIETHGTGTVLGDRIEFDALRAAYGSQPLDSCLLGALKANVGHLGAAAGLAGLVKAVLALEAGVIPPAAGFERPAPGLEFERSRFAVNTSSRPWPLSGPRRAAVHSTAVGGSNVHVILQEAPPDEEGRGQARNRLPARPFDRVRCWVEPPAGSRERTEARISAPRMEPATVHGLLAAWFEEHLGHGPVGENDDFFEMGGTSMDALSLIAAIESECKIRLPGDALFRQPTPAGLAGVIEAIRSSDHDLVGGALDDGVDLTGDWALEPGIRPSGRPGRTAVSSVLLTGATGFLGAHVLNALLAAEPRLTVLCLVRAASVEDGRRRIQERFRELGLLEAVVDARVVPVPADLGQQRFGMTASEFAVLAHATDSIIHCASQVSYVAGYPVLRSTNVDGVREVLRLAGEGLEKPVHHVSSIAVFEADSLRGVDSLTEDTPLDRCHGFHNGYDLSKWVAERMIGLARQRGMAVSVYRPSNIAGDRRSGIVLPAHIIARFLKGCLQLGVAPEDVTINLVCADAVAQAIARRALEPSTGALDFHLVNPEATPLRALIRWTQSRGYALEPIPYSEWSEKMIHSPRDNAFRPFLPLLQQGPVFTGRTYAREQTDTVLGPKARFDPFDEALFGRHLDHLVRIGFIGPAGVVELTRAK